jgi:hypothetical protein
MIGDYLKIKLFWFQPLYFLHAYYRILLAPGLWYPVSFGMVSVQRLVCPVFGQPGSFGVVVMAACYGIRHRDFHPDLDRLNCFMAQAALSTIDLSGLAS